MDPVHAQSAETPRAAEAPSPRFKFAALVVAVLLVALPFVHMAWRGWLERDYREAYATWLAEPEVRARATFEPQEILVVRCQSFARELGGEQRASAACSWLFASPVQEVCTAKPPAFECHLEER